MTELATGALDFDLLRQIKDMYVVIMEMMSIAEELTGSHKQACRVQRSAGTRSRSF